MRESGVGNGRKLLEPASEVEYMTVEIGEWNGEWERERECVGFGPLVVLCFGWCDTMI